MPTVDEIYERAKSIREKGGGQRKAHFGLIDVEAKERIANPKGRTRLIKELGSSEAYAEWNVEFDKWYEAAGNPVIAQSLMLRCLQQWSPEMIERAARDDSEAT